MDPEKEECREKKDSLERESGKGAHASRENSDQEQSEEIQTALC